MSEYACLLNDKNKQQELITSLNKKLESFGRKSKRSNESTDISSPVEETKVNTNEETKVNTNEQIQGDNEIDIVSSNEQIDVTEQIQDDNEIEIFEPNKINISFSIDDTFSVINDCDQSIVTLNE